MDRESNRGRETNGRKHAMTFFVSFPSGSIFVSSVPENSELKEHVNETRLSFGLLYGRNKPPEEMQFFTQTLGSGSLIVRQGEMSVPHAFSRSPPNYDWDEDGKLDHGLINSPRGKSFFPTSLTLFHSIMQWNGPVPCSLASFFLEP